MDYALNALALEFPLARSIEAETRPEPQGRAHSFLASIRRIRLGEPPAVAFHGDFLDRREQMATAVLDSCMYQFLMALIEAERKNRESYEARASRVTGGGRRYGVISETARADMPVLDASRATLTELLCDGLPLVWKCECTAGEFSVEKYMCQYEFLRGVDPPHSFRAPESLGLVCQHLSAVEREELHKRLRVVALLAIYICEGAVLKTCAPIPASWAGEAPWRPVRGPSSGIPPITLSQPPFISQALCVQAIENPGYVCTMLYAVGSLLSALMEPAALVHLYHLDHMDISDVEEAKLFIRYIDYALVHTLTMLSFVINSLFCGQDAEKTLIEFVGRTFERIARRDRDLHGWGRMFSMQPYNLAGLLPPFLFSIEPTKLFSIVDYTSLDQPDGELLCKCYALAFVARLFESILEFSSFIDFDTKVVLSFKLWRQVYNLFVAIPSVKLFPILASFCSKYAKMAKIERRGTESGVSKERAR